MIPNTHKIIKFIIFLLLLLTIACKKNKRTSYLEAYSVDEKDFEMAMKIYNSMPPENLKTPNPHQDAQWFPKAGLGLFIHWGIHSVVGLDPSWTMVRNCGWHRPSDKYASYAKNKQNYYDLASRFDPQKYDPEKWVSEAKKAGFTYVVLTTKHHDGYALWPSKFGNMNTGVYMNGRDLLKPYVEACKKHDLKVGFYFSPRDWRYPGFPQFFNQQNKFDTPPLTSLEIENAYEEFYAYTIGQISELLNRYGKIDLLWFDGVNWNGIDDIKAKQTIAWIRSIQPHIVVNQRFIKTRQKTNKIGDYSDTEMHLPDKKRNEWWETCTIWPKGHWGYVKEEEFKSLDWVFDKLVTCRSWGGNLLLNVGPRPDGTMPDVFYNYCDTMANWMLHSRKSLIKAKPTPGEEKSNVPITRDENNWYLHVLREKLPDEIKVINVPKPNKIFLLSTGLELDYKYEDKNILIKPSSLGKLSFNNVIAINLSK